MLQRVADQTESLNQKLSDFIAAFEKRFAPLEPIPQKLEALTSRVAALEAIEQQAKGAVWLGRSLLVGAGFAADYLLKHFTH